MAKTATATKSGKKTAMATNLGGKNSYGDKFPPKNDMAIKLGRNAIATNLGVNTMAVKLVRNLFNASTTGPLVKSAQVFRLRKKAAKERPATRQLVFWQEFLQVLERIVGTPKKNSWKAYKNLERPEKNS